MSKEVEQNIDINPDKRLQNANRIAQLSSVAIIVGGVVMVTDAILDYIPDSSTFASAYSGVVLLATGIILQKINKQPKLEEND